jgi:DNA mismatch endonuclease, patch repair protein
MSRMPVRSTGPELALRKELFRLGMRFRLHDRTLPGRPDVVLTRARIAIFVDGCFWHRCSSHCVMPKNNASWWSAKLNGNVDRDRRNDASLQERGWWPVHVWEHEDPHAAALKIAELWKARRA